MDDSRLAKRRALRDLVRSGYKVFPCAVGEKHPQGTLAPHGVYDATDDWGKINAWWPEAGGPDYNVGVSADGLCLIDIDGEDNPWLASLTEAQAAELAACPRVHTPGGGLHVWTKKPSWAKWGNTQSLVAPKVDTRASGGYVIAPPSVGANGKPYRFDADAGLRPRDELPLTPVWLHDKLPEAGESSERGEVDCTIGPAESLPAGKRNGGLLSIGGTMRRWGMTYPEIEAALQAVNLQRCEPPLAEVEVRQIARSASRYEAGDEFAHIAGEAGKGFVASEHTEFMAASHEHSFLIDNLVVAQQHLIIGGQQKTFKTSILVDLCLSMAAGKPALGHYAVPEPVRCLIVSGESGSATLQATARRVMDARGIQTADVGASLFWGERLPNLTMLEHLENLRLFIEENGIGFCAIDPAYLALMLGDDAKNVFHTGQVLKRFGQIGTDTGCTLCLCHHLNKASNRRDKKPPQLADLSMAGFAEWTRQWILIGHREDYSRGRADLVVNVGGSAGHGSIYQWEIDQGRRRKKAVGWEAWRVAVTDLDPDEGEEFEAAEGPEETPRPGKKPDIQRHVANARRLAVEAGGKPVGAKAAGVKDGRPREDGLTVWDDVAAAVTGGDARFFFTPERKLVFVSGDDLL